MHFCFYSFLSIEEEDELKEREDAEAAALMDQLALLQSTDPERMRLIEEAAAAVDDAVQFHDVSFHRPQYGEQAQR